MTLDPEIPAGNGAGAILRALGSLMAALGGEEPHAAGATARVQAPRYAPAPHEPSPYQAPAYPAPAYPAPPYDAPPYQAPGVGAARPAGSRAGGAAAEAELVLSEARERADRILRESMERANLLLARERSAAGGENGEPLRRAIDELLRGMRDMQARLAHIESILVARPVAPPPPMPETPVRPES